MYQAIRSFVKGTLVVVPISITFIDCVGYVAKVEGNSMHPALNPINEKNSHSDFILLSRWKIRKFDVKHGDVVSLYSPKDPDTKLVKRVIGLEGDWIKTIGYHKRYIQVPEGHCWVEGDHHSNSMDSNNFGPVPLGLLNARATHIVWPMHRWQALECFVKNDRKPVNTNLHEIFRWRDVDEDIS